MRYRRKLKMCICGHSILEHEDECLGCHEDNCKDICIKFIEKQM